MEILTAIVGMVFSGGPNAVLGCCVVVIIGLMIDRARLIKVRDTKTERLDEIIDEYHESDLGLAVNLSALKNSMFEIRMKF